MALPLFAITLFVSAFLLFLVQPMIGKLILPKLGGTPQVWNTCMMFFQMVLLAGYAYTHTLTTRLPVRKQIFVHLAMLILPFVFLLPNGPFNVTGFEPPVGTNPIWYTLGVLAMIVGVPFLVVSTSAPLLQRWFGETGHPASSDPYFLYGASNLGSLLSLLAYPFLVEPWLVLHEQTWVWVFGYVALAAMIAACIYLIFQSPTKAAQFQFAGAPAESAAVPEPAAVAAPAVESSTAVKEGPAPAKPAVTGITRSPGKKKGFRPGGAAPMRPADVERVGGPVYDRPRSDVMTWGRRIRWILLAAIPTSLMLGVTTFVSTDLSPFPLLWVIPLALYLLTFVLVFARWPVLWTDVPHQIVLFVQPIGILALCFIMFQGGFQVFMSTFLAFLGFFLTALMCHGELARDRPSTRYLTEFFLLMSVGGAIGGTFNAMVAPILFTGGIVEYPLAIFLSCFLRPALTQNGWLDQLLIGSFPNLETWAQERGDEMAKSFGKEPPHTNYILNYSLDIILALFVLALAWLIKSNISAINRFIGNTDSPGMMNLILFGIPMCFVFFFSWRPVRFGLAVGALILVHVVWSGEREGTLYKDRSYFGVLRVLRGGETQGDPEPYTYLMHGTTYHGRCYLDEKIERVPTTYYHRMGPVGKIMERYYWWSPAHATPPRPVTDADLRSPNAYAADARGPAAIMGMLSNLGTSTLPVDAITHCWSEPPFATIGLGTGTMVAYARPFQHMTYYEIDQKIVNFSLPPPGRQTYFTYLNRAIRRGVNLELIMGDARQSMKLENPSSSRTFLPEGMDYSSENSNIIEDNTNFMHFQGREKYYKVLNVDAFSSDAIPIHLITVEAIQLYMSKITDDGVLCMHTSNRHMNLVEPLTDICKQLGLKYRVGHDESRSGRGVSAALGHFGSEYVMIARDEKLLPAKTARPIPLGPQPGWQQTWHMPPAAGRRVWTDDYSNILSILR